jgi:hypothetical protein
LTSVNYKLASVNTIASFLTEGELVSFKCGSHKNLIGLIKIKGKS